MSSTSVNMTCQISVRSLRIQQLLTVSQYNTLSTRNLYLFTCLSAISPMYGTQYLPNPFWASLNFTRSSQSLLEAWNLMWGPSIEVKEVSDGAKGAVSQILDGKDHDFTLQLTRRPFKATSSVTDTTVIWCGALGYVVQSHEPKPIRPSVLRSDKDWTLGYHSERGSSDIVDLGTGPRDTVGACHRVMILRRSSPRYALVSLLLAPLFDCL